MGFKNKKLATGQKTRSNNKNWWKIPPNKSCEQSNVKQMLQGKPRKPKVRGQQRRRQQKKERGHLFVPSCAAKSLTEAIVNDIGESLQSEELRGAEEGGKREQTDEEASIFSREEEASPQSLGVGEKPGQASCFVTIARQRFVFPPPTPAWLTVPGMCVLVLLWPLGPVVVVLRIFFFLRSRSRCSFCLFCTSISSEMKLFFTWI